VRDLEAAGADVWVDKRGITSDDFVQKISEGLAGRQWLVLVMTPEALQSPWVRREVNAALNEQTAGRMLGVLPLIMRPCPEKDIPLLWRPLHRYDATEGYATARDALLQAMGLFLPEEPTAPGTTSLGVAGARAARLSRRQVLVGTGLTGGLVAVGGVAWLTR
jgi:hypothetical protein